MIRTGRWVLVVVGWLLGAAPASGEEWTDALAAFAEGRLEARSVRARLVADGERGVGEVVRLVRAGAPTAVLPLLVDVPGGVPALVDLLREDDRLAAPALAALSATEGVEPLLDAATAPRLRDEVRAQAVVLLVGRLRRDVGARLDARARLTRTALDPAADAAAADAALRVLVEVDGWAAIETLLARLEGPRPEPALALAARLRPRGPAAGERLARGRLQGALLALATGPLAAVERRRLAVLALGAPGDERAGAPLVEPPLEGGGPAAPEAVTDDDRPRATTSDPVVPPPGSGARAPAVRADATPGGGPEQRVYVVAALAACVLALVVSVLRRRAARRAERRALLALLETAQRQRHRILPRFTTRARSSRRRRPTAVLAEDDDALREGIAALRAAEEALAADTAALESSETPPRVFPDDMPELDERTLDVLSLRPSSSVEHEPTTDVAALDRPAPPMIALEGTDLTVTVGRSQRARTSTEGRTIVVPRTARPATRANACRSGASNTTSSSGRALARGATSASPLSCI